MTVGSFKHVPVSNADLKLRRDSSQALLRLALHVLTPAWFQNPLSSAGYSPICPPCDNEMKTDAMLEHMCASEFGKNATPTPDLATKNTETPFDEGLSGSHRWSEEP